MVLDKEIKAQLAQYLNLLESDIVLQTDLGDDDNSRKVKEFLDEIVAMSDRISLESTHLKRQPSFGIAQKGQKKSCYFLWPTDGARIYVFHFSSFASFWSSTKS